MAFSDEQTGLLALLSLAAGIPVSFFDRDGTLLCTVQDGKTVRYADATLSHAEILGTATITLCLAHAGISVLQTEEGNVVTLLAPVLAASENPTTGFIAVGPCVFTEQADFDPQLQLIPYPGLLAHPAFSAFNPCELTSGGLAKAVRALIACVAAWPVSQHVRGIAGQIELMNTEFDEAGEAARHATSAKAEFLAKRNHEIRNPMCGSIGSSGLLRGMELEPEARDFAPADQPPVPADAETKINILIAEDNPVNQKVAAGLLSRKGYRFMIAETGLQAVEMVKSGEFDLVLMDCQMPEMDGCDATVAIRQLPGHLANIPIIAMTANTMAGDREKCLAAGMDEFLSKPVNPGTLYMFIDQFTTAARGAERAAKPTREAPHDRLSDTNESSGPVRDSETSAAATESRRETSQTTSRAIDIEASIARAGDAEFWRELALAFIEESNQCMKLLEQSLEKGDVKTFTRAAHTIKGSAAELVAEPLRQAAYQLELLGKSGILTAAPSRIDELREIFANVQADIEHWLARMDSV